VAETVSTFQLIGNQFDGWKSHIPFFADFSGDFGQGVFSCTKTKPGKHLGEMELNSTHHTITGMTNTNTQKGEKNLNLSTSSSSNSLATYGVFGVM